MLAIHSRFIGVYAGLPRGAALRGLYPSIFCLLILSGESPPDFIVEECKDAEEADAIVSHYRAIIAKIRKQQEEQS